MPQSPVAGSTALSASGTPKSLDQELLLRKTKFEKAWEVAARLMQADQRLLPYFDCMIQFLNCTMKVTDAQTKGGENVLHSSQLLAIDTGFGRSLARAKPLLEKRSLKRGNRKEKRKKCPLVVPNLQATLT